MARISNEYDFIVVGGGTSGLVIAARLSEDPSMSVLVLEAGGNHLNNPNVNIPALWQSLIGSDLDWDFATTPQHELSGRIIKYPQGRVLGGSSALNAEAFIAPTEVGINYWSDCGNPGWDWKTLSPYYRKCHTLIKLPDEVCAQLGLDYLIGREEVNGDGPIVTSYTSPVENPLGKVWADTFRNLNYGPTSDPFCGKSTGGFANLTSVDPRTKERSYSASAYFAPVQNRPNLHLSTETVVEQITLENKHGLITANGVVITKEGIRHTFTSKRDVILAAGALNSPKLLELSGIGNKSILESYGIDVVIENPNVGENLHDHPMTGVSFAVKDGVQTLDKLSRHDPEAVEAAVKAYQSNKSGPFSGASINSFASMPVAQFQTVEGKSALKDLLETWSSTLYATGHRAEEEFVESVISSTDESSVIYFMFAANADFDAKAANVKDIAHTREAGNYITICALLSYPLSRGSVHIRSASTADKPTVDPKFLDNPMDLEILARHLQFLESLSLTEPLSSLIKLEQSYNGGCTSRREDLEAARDYVRRTVRSGWHPVGSCAMRPREKGGVVNERLIVHGTTNLRVVDASIMPLISGGNPQSTVYAVAERAADLIKEDYASSL